MASLDSLERRLRIESVDEDMAAVLRQKTPEERLGIAFGMIESARSMLDAMLTDQRSDGPAKKIDAEVARRNFHGEVPENLRQLRNHQELEAFL